MELSFSTRHVATLVYAFAALDRCNGDAESFIDVLCPDRYEALKMVIVSAMSELPLRLPGKFTDMKLPGADGEDCARFTIDDAHDVSRVASLRPMIERWLAYSALAVIHSGADDGVVADRYSARAAEIIGLLGNAFDADSDMIGQITACLY